MNCDCPPRFIFSALRRQGRARTIVIAVIVIVMALSLILIPWALTTKRIRQVRLQQTPSGPPSTAGPNDYYVTGSVVRGGIYTIRDGTAANVKQAIAAAGGVSSKGTTVSVTRRDPSGRETKLIDSVDTQELFDGKHPDIDLRGADLVYVAPPVTGEYYVDGEVKRAGVYSLSARKISLRQALAAAGGLDQGVKDAFIEVMRPVGETADFPFKTSNTANCVQARAPMSSSSPTTSSA